MRRRPLALLVTALLVGVGGCGGVDRATYLDEVRAIQERTTADATARSSRMADGRSPAEIAAQLRGLGTSVERNAAALGRVEAPGDVEALHAEYVGLLRDYGRDLRALSTRVGRAGSDDTEPLLRRASTLTVALAERERRIVESINARLR